MKLFTEHTKRTFVMLTPAIQVHTMPPQHIQC